MPGTAALPQNAAVAMYLALALLIIFARGLGELAIKLKQPAIIVAGVLLGKTVFARIWPAAFSFIFGPGLAQTAVAAISNVASTMFMLVAGLEMDLNEIMKNKRRPLIIGICSVIVPFGLGYGVTYANPTLLGATPGQDPSTYALFAGTAMAITAMPVVAKTLRDVGLLRSEFGRIVMSAASVDDLIGWSLFAVVLSLSASSSNSSLPGLGVGGEIGLSIAFVLFVGIFGRLAFPRFFLWVQAKFSYPGGVLGAVVGWTFTCACIGNVLGLNNTLASFLVGVSLSNNRHFRSRVREVVDEFVTYCLAPIFFGYIAIGADFIADFDVALVAIVLVVSCVGKILGATIGSRISGSSWREAVAIATCMNSRGAMEILLANVALSANVIDGRMYVGLVLMAIVTSLLPGPVLRRILRRHERKPFTLYIPNPDGFISDLKASTAETALQELCEAIHKPELIEAVIAHEHTTPSGNADQLAICYIRVEGLHHPVIGLGISKTGIDFSGQLGFSGEHPILSHIIVVALFPASRVPTRDITLDDDVIQQISMVFARPSFRAEFIRTTQFLEVQSLVKFEIHRIGLHSAIEEMGPRAVAPGNVPGDDIKSSVRSAEAGSATDGEKPEVADQVDAISPV